MQPSSGLGVSDSPEWSPENHGSDGSGQEDDGPQNQFLDQVVHVDKANILYNLNFVREYRWVHLALPASMALKVFSSLK